MASAITVPDSCATLVEPHDLEVFSDLEFLVLTNLRTGEVVLDKHGAAGIAHLERSVPGHETAPDHAVPTRASGP